MGVKGHEKCVIRVTMKKTLVTGGCGFVGGAVARHLCEKGIAVRVLALPNETTKNVDDLDVEVMRGNVLSIEDCRKAVDGVDTVFHLAAIYNAHMPNPTLMYEVNCGGTFNVLEVCRQAGVEKVIYTSSMVALGRPEVGQLGNESTPYDAWDIDFAYSRSKYHSHGIAKSFAAFGLDVRIICPGLVLGPGDVTPTPSGKLILEALGGAPPVYMDGGAAYVDVRDAAKVHVAAAEKGQAGETYLAVGHNLDNRQFVEALASAMGENRRLFKVPVRVARTVVRAMNTVARWRDDEPKLPRNFFEYSLKPSFYDNSKSVTELGVTYRPIVDTIRDTIRYFEENGMT